MDFVPYSKGDKPTECGSNCTQVGSLCPVPPVSLVCLVVISLAPFQDFHRLASFHHSVHRQIVVLARKMYMARVTVTMCSFDGFCLFEAWSKAVSYTSSHRALDTTKLYARPVVSVIFCMLEDSKHYCKNK